MQISAYKQLCTVSTVSSYILTICAALACLLLTCLLTVPLATQAGYPSLLIQTLWVLTSVQIVAAILAAPLVVDFVTVVIIVDHVLLLSADTRFKSLL